MNAPLLFLHGFAGGPETFQSLTARLERPYLAPYLCGHGDLSSSQWTGDFEEEIARLGQMIRDEWEAARTHVVGYSLGARVGLGLVARYPELVSGATLIGVHPGLASDSERTGRRDHDRRFIELLETEGIERFVATWEALPIFASQAGLDREIVELQRRVRLGHSARGLAHAMRTLGLAEMPDFWPLLSTIDRPVTLVVGALDQKFEKLAREMVALLPQASVVLAPGCGHNVLLEAPGLVARVLGERLECS